MYYDLHWIYVSVERFQDSKKNVPLQVVRLRDVQQTFRYWKRPEGPRESEEKRSLLRCTALPLIFFHQSIIKC